MRNYVQRFRQVATGSNLHQLGESCLLSMYSASDIGRMRNYWYEKFLACSTSGDRVDSTPVR